MRSAKNCTVGQYSTYDHVQGMLAGRVEGSSECVAKLRVSSLEFRVSSFEFRVSKGFIDCVDCLVN